MNPYRLSSRQEQKFSVVFGQQESPIVFNMESSYAAEEHDNIAKVIGRFGKAIPRFWWADERNFESFAEGLRTVLDLACHSMFRYRITSALFQSQMCLLRSPYSMILQVPEVLCDFKALVMNQESDEDSFALAEHCLSLLYPRLYEANAIFWNEMLVFLIDAALRAGKNDLATHVLQCHKFGMNDDSLEQLSSSHPSFLVGAWKSNFSSRQNLMVLECAVRVKDLHAAVLHYHFIEAPNPESLLPKARLALAQFDTSLLLSAFKSRIEAAPDIAASGVAFFLHTSKFKEAGELISQFIVAYPDSKQPDHKLILTSLLSAVPIQIVQDNFTSLDEEYSKAPMLLVFSRSLSFYHDPSFQQFLQLLSALGFRKALETLSFWGFLNHVNTNFYHRKGIFTKPFTRAFMTLPLETFIADFDTGFRREIYIRCARINLLKKAREFECPELEIAVFRRLLGGSALDELEQLLVHALLSHALTRAIRHEEAFKQFSTCIDVLSNVAMTRPSGRKSWFLKWTCSTLYEICKMEIEDSRFSVHMVARFYSKDVPRRIRTSERKDQLNELSKVKLEQNTRETCSISTS